MYSMSKKPLLGVASFPPISVSFYFHSTDRAFCEALDRHLTPLKRNGQIQTWDDQQIMAGQEWDREHEHHLTTDRLLVLLISPDFLASETFEHQMDIALQRHSNGDATVIPILVRPCFWEQTQLEKFQILPREQIAVGVQPSPEALQKIAVEINQVINSIQQRVFVAYAPEDGDMVERLHRDLTLSSMRLWSPKRQQLTPDLGQNKEIRNAMRDASIVFLIVSPATTSSSAVQAQMALAADYHRPILVIWANGEDWDQPYSDDWRPEAIIDARAERYEIACTEIVAYAKQQRRMIVASQTEFFTLKEPRNPYKGLRPFTEKDTSDFFGREALIDQLAHALEHIILQEKKEKLASRLMTIIGASGSGKSSVVMAGLLPYLQQQGIGDSQEWVYLEPMRPSNHPLEGLAISLAQQPSLKNGVAGDVLSLNHALDSDSFRTLHILARQLAGSSSRKVVLIIDQFEEVFTLTTSEEERQRFFNLLVTAVTEPQGPLLIILTLRADFYDRPMLYPKLYRLLDAHRISVLPMEREDLRRIIEQPAQLPDVQLTFEGDMVGDLLFEVREQGTSLPLLQFTLEQLFERREGHQLTLQAYRDMGGVKGALVKHADETYATLPSEEYRKLAQTLFTRLIESGTTQKEMLRRRAISEEFELPDPRLTQLLHQTMNAFIAARLLTINQVLGTTTIEVSHEALIREWPLCAQWIQETYKNRPFQQTLSKDVAQWKELGEPKERLYHGSQLKVMRKRIDRSLLNKQEVRFFHASIVYQRQQWIRTIALLISPVIVLGLIFTPLLILRPSWCQSWSWLCPAPQVLLAKGGAYDSNLQVTFQTLQSSIKVIPSDPSTYHLSNLPTVSDAQLITTSQSFPYRVVLKIHSLQQGRYGLAIDQVKLVIKRQVQVIPYPLRIWIAHNISTFNNNLYRITYRGQAVNKALTALYVEQPSGFIPLLPGETDDLSLEVRSTFVVDLHFQVQVTYHVIGQLASHTLTLPNTFEVIFSDQANWHPYQLQNGHLVATTL